MDYQELLELEHDTGDEVHDWAMSVYAYGEHSVFRLRTSRSMTPDDFPDGWRSSRRYNYLNLRAVLRELRGADQGLYQQLIDSVEEDPNGSA